MSISRDSEVEVVVSSVHSLALLLLHAAPHDDEGSADKLDKVAQAVIDSGKHFGQTKLWTGLLLRLS